MKYQGASLARTLKSYLETGLSDLVNPNDVICKVIDGEDYSGRDDYAEAEVTINGCTFVFHLEGANDDDPKKACGLLGVLEKESENTVSGPNDPITWSRIEHFVRWASK